MIIDLVLRTHIRTGFALLNNAAANTFPGPNALSQALSRTLPAGSKGLASRATTQDVARMFTTAAVNIWMRAVHNFLVSASLTNVSPIWASVAGYYSSHYSVRALAH